MPAVLPLAGFIAALTLCGCGSNAITKKDIDKPTSSLVYGYVDMKAAPSDVQYATVKQITPPSDKPYWGFGANQNAFYHEALPPGEYKISHFGGYGRLNILTFFLNLLFGPTEHEYHFYGGEADFVLKRPGLYYLGCFKYARQKDSFKLETVKEPGEAEVLKRVLPRIRNTKWEPMAKKRIKELGG